MLKLGVKSATLLLLLSAMTGGLAVTNASAMSKSTRQSLTARKNSEEKVTKTSKKVDQVFDQVGVRNLNALTANRYNGDITYPETMTTYKLASALTMSNEFRKKKVVLPAKTVVNGGVDSLNFLGVNNLDLSKKNQRRVFNAVGSKYSGSVSLTNTGNVDGQGKPIFVSYQKNTAFSHQGMRNLPDLYSKNLQSYNDNDRQANPFLTVTSDNYLNYYSSNYETNVSPSIGLVPNYTKYAQSVKIKKFTRGKANYTYYLAKPLTGFGTKKVHVGQAVRYKLKVSLGHVFRAYDNYNGDPGGYRMTVNVGKKK